MKIKNLLISLSVISFCLNFQAKGQDFVDLARTYSQREISGTARMQGMGGVSTSLGGDLSSTIGNPAGLGFFNRSEFSFSPSLGIHNTDATYLGQSTSDYKTNFNFGTIGVILNKTKNDPESAWKGGSFGISYSRINDFHSRLNYRGLNYEYDFPTSALDRSFYDNAGLIGFDDVRAELAFETYLIDEFFDPETNEYFLDTYNDRSISPGFPVRQQEIITTKGAGYSTNFGYGGNFSDKFYIGVSFAFSSINYEIDRTFNESPTNTELDNLTLEETRQIEGSGFNFSLGTIYRPISSLSIGVSYTTPTYYSIEDYLGVNLVAEFRDSINSFSFPYEGVTPVIQYNYRTPGHLNAGISYFVGKHGFISADVEYIDYTGNKYSSNQDDFTTDNDNIDNVLASAFNYRIGGEYRLNIFRFRAGYSFFDDPTDKKIRNSIDRSRESFSIGAGIKLPTFYADLAVINTQYESSYVPYYNELSAAIDQNSTRAMLTLGFNF